MAASLELPDQEFYPPQPIILTVTVPLCVSTTIGQAVSQASSVTSYGG